MTPRQQTAFTEPCARAHDTIAPAFGALQRLDHKRVVSTILTVNK